MDRLRTSVSSFQLFPFPSVQLSKSVNLNTSLILLLPTSPLFLSSLLVIHYHFIALCARASRVLRTIIYSIASRLARLLTGRPSFVLTAHS